MSSLPTFLVSTLVLASCGGGTDKVAPPSTQAAPPSKQGEPAPTQAAEPTYEDALMAIAKDIESLKGEFPQLADFSAAKHYDAQRLVIGYAYKTHRPQGRAGWAGAVPNPDDDGVWFHIDFHDPDSGRQIHTQPDVPVMFYRDKKVMFLMLEGAQTQSLSGPINGILQKRGVRFPQIHRQ